MAVDVIFLEKGNIVYYREHEKLIWIRKVNVEFSRGGDFDFVVFLRCHLILKEEDFEKKFRLPKKQVPGLDTNR